MLTDPEKLAAALEQLETERQRRIDERVEKGELQSASRPSCARCGIWRTQVYLSRRALHPVRPHARRAGSFEKSY